jgi:hypothetical protein
MTRIFLKTIKGPYLLMDAAKILADPLNPPPTFKLPLIGGGFSNDFWWMETRNDCLIYREMITMDSPEAA